jgi:hypothetical protein
MKTGTPVPCQNPFISAVLAFHARTAALRYSLIRPLRTCLRSIRAVMSMARADFSGGCRAMR